MALQPRVLIVDDDPLLLRCIARGLSRRGWEVVQAEGGVAALDLLSTERPFDAVVCDLNMPDLDGTEVVAALPESMQRRTVMCHGGICSEPHRRFFEDFRGAVVSKPCPVDVLLATLERILGRRAA